MSLIPSRGAHCHEALAESEGGCLLSVLIYVNRQKLSGHDSIMNPEEVCIPSGALLVALLVMPARPLADI